MSSESWHAHAYPLQQITIKLQGTRHSNKDDVIDLLETVLARLKSGDTSGHHHDDDFGYAFEYNGTAEGPSFFELDASKKAMKAQIDAGIETALSEIKASFVADKNSSLELIAEAGNQTKRIAFINILAAALTTTAAVLVVFF